jgi:diguanylate cyclase (GGDEF)-like protein
LERIKILATEAPPALPDSNPADQKSVVFGLPPLARALTWRMVVLLLAVVILTLTSITTFVIWQGDQEQRAEDLNARQMVARRLDLLRDSWQREAENIVTGIELQRITSQPEATRWHSLRAWLVAMGESISFDTVIVVDQTGQVRFIHGHESGEYSARPPKKQVDWYLSPENREFHAVIRSSLWLGADSGRGEVIFLQPILPSTLQLIGSDKQPLYLATTSALLAASDAVQIPIKAGSTFKVNQQNWRLISAPIDAEDEARFLIRLPVDQPVWLIPVLIGALVLGLALALGFHLLLGRWARELVLRIETLSRAAHAFGDERHPNLPSARALLCKAKEKNDEVGALADTLESLMDVVYMREEENRAYIDTLNLLEEVVIELDLNGGIRRASSAWRRLSGLADEVNTMPATASANTFASTIKFHDCLHPDDSDQMQTVLEGIASHEKDQITLRARLRGKTATDTWVECRFVPLRDGGSQVIGVRGVLRDVTQTYMQEKQITHMALHDALTGLPNRVLLEDRAKMAIRIARRSTHKVGLCFFDLDHFKQINDTLGHKAGDRLLIVLSEAVRDRLRDGDTLARWGGDEFVLLIPDMKSSQDIREVVAQIADITREPLTVDGAEFAVTFSMGVTIYPDDADNLDALLSQADRAMFYAKAQGRNTYQFFADMSQKGLGKKDLYIQHRLAAAIKNNEILAWFQPLVDTKTGHTLGLEALARWHDAELGWVSPASFIPMAENLGLIRELGEQVLTATLSAGRDWKARGFDLGLAVNVSKRQLFMPEFTEKLIKDSQYFGIAPQRITLEITESVALMDVEFAMERLNELSRAGFRIAIDDFGTGYSSLSQLHDMPVHEIKIDISFVRRIHTPQGLRVVQAIIQMASAIRLECVAEGVEDAVTAEMLAQLGVNTLQGFHFAKPMPQADFDAWMMDHAA